MSANLYVKHGVDNVIEATARRAPVVVRGRSRGTTFADNLFGGGLKLEAYENPQGRSVEQCRAGGRRRRDLPSATRRATTVSRRSRSTAERDRGPGLRPATNHCSARRGGVRLDLAGGATLACSRRPRPGPQRRGARGRRGAHRGPRRHRRRATRPATDAAGAARFSFPLIASMRRVIPLTPITITRQADGFAESRTVLTIARVDRDRHARDERGATRPRASAGDATRSTSLPISVSSFTTTA